MPKRSISSRSPRQGPRPRKVRGRGSYVSDLWQKGRKYIPRLIGGAVGLAAGKPVTGWKAGASFSKKVLGWGAYSAGSSFSSPWKGSMNSLVTLGNTPQVANVADAGLRINHQEYLGSVYSTTNFTNVVYPVNPGLSSTFPWLNKIASNFQEYRLLGMLVTFKSSLTDAIADFKSLGAVIIAADQNSAAPKAPSQVAMEQMQFVSSAKASETIVAPIECAPRLGGAGLRYIRVSSVPSGASILDYDACQIQVATVGQPSVGVELGRLYLSYDIELLNPKMQNPGGDAAYFKQVDAKTQTATYPFGIGAAPSVIYDEIGIVFPLTASTGYKSFTIPAGAGSEFRLDIEYNGDAVTTALPTVTYANAAASARTLIGFVSSAVYPSAGTTVANYAYTLYFKVTDPTLSATLSFSGLAIDADNGLFGLSIQRLPAVTSLGAEPLPVIEEKDDVKEDFFMPPSVGAAAAGITPLNRMASVRRS